MSVKSRKFLGMQFILDKKLQLRNLCVFEHRNTAAFLNDIVLMVLSRYDRASAAILVKLKKKYRIVLKILITLKNRLRNLILYFHQQMVRKCLICGKFEVRRENIAQPIGVKLM